VPHARKPAALKQGMDLALFATMKTDPYLVKNALLLTPAEWMIDPEVSKAIEDTKPTLKNFHGWTPESTKPDTSFRDVAKPEDFAILSHVTEHLPEVFSVPFFSENYCKLMLDEIQNIKDKNLFKVNEGEEKDVQIEEFVFSVNSPGWYDVMFQLIYAKVNTIFEAIFHRKVNTGIIQLANYNPREVTQTSWHHDGGADITMVIPLNTSEYEGGGTEFWRKGVVDPLPNGHALMFPTFSNMHRGLPLKSGDRYLFVFWLKYQPVIEENNE